MIRTVAGVCQLPAVATERCRPAGRACSPLKRWTRVQSMRSFTHWRWHLDEVYVKINGEMHYLWRTVDQEGEVLESFASKTRDKAAALTFMKKIMKRHGQVKAITTDGLRSYKAARKGIGNTSKQ